MLSVRGESGCSGLPKQVCPLISLITLHIQIAGEGCIGKPISDSIESTTKEYVRTSGSSERETAPNHFKVRILTTLTAACSEAVDANSMDVVVSDVAPSSAVCRKATEVR